MLTLQNLSFVIDGVNVALLTANQSLPTPTYSDCVAKIVCNAAQPSSWFDLCGVGPGASEIRNQLLSAFEEAKVDTKSYKQWVAVDKTTLENTKKTQTNL
jgi:hypothetical protein